MDASHAYIYIGSRAPYGRDCIAPAVDLLCHRVVPFNVGGPFVRNKFSSPFHQTLFLKSIKAFKSIIRRDRALLVYVIYNAAWDIMSKQVLVTLRVR